MQPLQVPAPLHTVQPANVSFGFHTLTYFFSSSLSPLSPCTFLNAACTLGSFGSTPGRPAMAALASGAGAAGGSTTSYKAGRIHKVSPVSKHMSREQHKHNRQVQLLHCGSCTVRVGYELHCSPTEMRRSHQMIERCSAQPMLTVQNEQHCRSCTVQEERQRFVSNVTYM